MTNYTRVMADWRQEDWDMLCCEAEAELQRELERQRQEDELHWLEQMVHTFGVDGVE